MNAQQIKHQQFEREKNTKALVTTITVSALVFLSFIFISWSLPLPVVPPLDEGIEVNLGNTDQGFGDIPPQIPGEPTELAQTNFTSPQTRQAAAETNPEVADNDEKDAPAITTSSKPAVKNNNAAENTESVKKNTQPVTVAKPTPPKPKAVYAGGKSTSGGNNADSYNKSTSQGNDPGTKGDKGSPNGNPNSDSYTGNGGTGSSGIRITDGLSGRRAVSNTRFEDTYKYGGTVYVNVTVDENGNVSDANIKQGSPFSDINRIALTRAKQVKFSKGSSVQTGTIQIKFENPKG